LFAFLDETIDYVSNSCSYLEHVIISQNFEVPHKETKASSLNKVLLFCGGDVSMFLCKNLLAANCLTSIYIFL